MGAPCEAETRRLYELAGHIEAAQGALESLRELVNAASDHERAKDKAFYYKDVVIPAMNALRRPCDALEMPIDKSAWPFPTYEDLLFEV